MVHYGKVAGSRSVMRFEVKDRAALPQTATRAAPQLLESFPIRQKPGL